VCHCLPKGKQCTPRYARHCLRRSSGTLETEASGRARGDQGSPGAGGYAGIRNANPVPKRPAARKPAARSSATGDWKTTCDAPAAARATADAAGRRCPPATSAVGPPQRQGKPSKRPHEGESSTTSQNRDCLRLGVRRGTRPELRPFRVSRNQPRLTVAGRQQDSASCSPMGAVLQARGALFKRVELRDVPQYVWVHDTFRESSPFQLPPAETTELSGRLCTHWRSSLFTAYSLLGGTQETDPEAR